MALHVGQFLKRFGPVCGWWTFPFERLIGSMQRMNHNSRVGGMVTSQTLMPYLTLLQAN
jgi:hypothetical protein